MSTNFTPHLSWFRFRPACSECCKVKGFPVAKLVKSFSFPTEKCDAESLDDFRYILSLLQSGRARRKEMQTPVGSRPFRSQFLLLSTGDDAYAQHKGLREPSE